MSFLQIGALWALPLVVVPLLIHWLYRRRHRTIAWPAMLFLRRATQHQNRPAKWRRWLILATRVLVLTAVVFALARPLSSGRFGVAASRLGDDSLAVVLLDRSPSMQRRLPDGASRQRAGLENIAATLTTLGQNEVILVESVNAEPKRLASATALTSDVIVQSASSEADLAEMLDVALKTIGERENSSVDVWVCTDRDQEAWRPQALAWNTMASAVAQVGPGVRFHRLEFADDARVDHAVSLSQIKHAEAGQGRGLLLTIEVRRDDGGDAMTPVEITVGNVTETVEVSVSGGSGQLANHWVGLPEDMPIGYGSLAVAADVNPANDQWYFVEPQSTRPRLSLVTQAPSDALSVVAEVQGDVENVADDAISQEGQGSTTSQLPAGWPQQDVACLLWQGPFPVGGDADRVRAFAEGGGSVVFFPSLDELPSGSFGGVRWSPWQRGPLKQARYDDYTFSLDAFRPVEGDVVVRARVGDQQCVIGRRRVGRGNVYFCGCDVLNADGRFTQDGVALYGLLAEAVAASRRTDRASRDAISGGPDDAARETDWSPAFSTRLLSDRLSGGTAQPVRWGELGHHAGVFALRSRSDASGRLLAVNRMSARAVHGSVLSAEQIDALVPEIRWDVVQVGPSSDQTVVGFAREIWYVVWLMVIAGLVFEAVLSLPRVVGGGT